MRHIASQQSPKARRSCALVLPLLLLAFAEQAASESSRIVAVGDIHGDFEAFTSILRETGLIDTSGDWVGEDALLVQTGDYLDRGPKVREVMDLLMALETQSAKQGGRVVALLGNHEMMNLMGDLRDVGSAAYLSFADKDSQKRRQKAYQDYLKLHDRRSRILGKQIAPEPKPEKDWMEDHPIGYLEYREALEPKGKYGRWLRDRAAVVQIQDTIFLHGGIHPELRSLTLDGINQRIRKEIETFADFRQRMVRQKLILPFFDLPETVEAAQLELKRLKGKGSRPDQPSREVAFLEDFLQFGNWLSVHPDGPLWFRGFAQWSEEEGREEIEALLGSYRAKHFVVGHTIRFSGQSQVRFRGKVFLIDTGMLSSFYPGGRATALEIQDGRFNIFRLPGDAN